MNKINNEPDFVGAGTSGAATHGAFVARQPLRIRFWRSLGFGWHEREMVDYRMMEDPRYQPGAITLDTHVHFDFLDRLRILLSGHVVVIGVLKGDVLPKQHEARSETCVLWPGHANT